jgi:sugar/nucleoside kinase (ribokinase family)
VARRGVVCGGSWCVDRNNVIDYWPQQDGHARILSEETQGGGSGTNMAVDLRRLAAPFPVEAITLVGDDADGRFLAGLCREFGIDAAQMHVAADVPTAVTYVMSVGDTGRRTFFYLPGTMALIGPEHFDFAKSSAAILHLGLPGTMDRMDAPAAGEVSGWVAVLKQAKAAGLRTNIELVTIPEARLGQLTRPCLPWLDYVIVNDFEAGAVAGLRTLADGTADPQACMKAAEAILGMGAAELVVVHFPEGCVAAARDGTQATRPAVNVPRDAIVGANGAGDAFAAGMILAIHEGWRLDDALKLAHATAAASLRSVTTNGAVVDWRECLRLAVAWGWRDVLD